jgi:hypothetical protein
MKLQKLREKIKFKVHLCASFLLKFSVCETTQYDLTFAGCLLDDDDDKLQKQFVKIQSVNFFGAFEV